MYLFYKERNNNNVIANIINSDKLNDYIRTIPDDALLLSNNQRYFVCNTKEELDNFADYIGDRLIKAKLAKCAEINTQRDIEVTKPYKMTIDGKEHLFQVSINNDIAWIRNGDKDTSTDWITVYNEIISLTKLDYKNITSHMGARSTTQHILARKRKDKVLSLSTVEEVEDYDITQIEI